MNRDDIANSAVAKFICGYNCTESVLLKSLIRYDLIGCDFTTIEGDKQ